tara:strand:- start:1751 stop:1966 length:216 start_codon:yes stop_codon:yes gene_type:complete
MKLNDEVIGHIARLVQMAILTGTDIVDNLRMMRLQEEEGELFLEGEYAKNASNNLEKMLEKVKEYEGRGQN